MNIALKDQTRHCGPCTLCCKVLAVPEVQSAQNEWCSHAHKGSGCDIYETRPQMCRTFECWWLRGLLPEWARPDKIHGVVLDVGDSLQVTEDPGYRGYASSQLEPLFQGVYSTNRVVTIICGDDYRIRGTPEVLQNIGGVTPLGVKES